jgi:hypothetical protein
MDFLETLTNLTIDEKFHRFLPDSLYKSHYQLSTDYGHSPQEWRTFLRDNHMFIESELAAIAEAEARSALSRLSNANGTEVAALKAILDKSKLINDGQKQNTKVVLMFIPQTNQPTTEPTPPHLNTVTQPPTEHFRSVAETEPERKSKFR